MGESRSRTDNELMTTTHRDGPTRKSWDMVAPWGGELRWDGDTVLDTRPVGRPPAAKWAVAWRKVRKEKGLITTADLARHLHVGWRVARVAVCCYEIRTRQTVIFPHRRLEVMGVYGGSV